MSRSYGFLSTYPPTQCGLATFTSALLQAMTGPGSTDRAGVVRVVDSSVGTSAKEVVQYLRIGAAGGAAGAVAALNEFDVVIVQHEFGIFGGPDGEDVLEVLDGLRVPVVVVLHTVLARPTPHQRYVLERVVGLAGAVVTMTETASRRLTAGYEVNPDKIVVIPHGAADGFRPTIGRSPDPMILTWGLLGPGKGIEWAIDGLRQIRHLKPEPRYVIAGQTHPRVRRAQGEAYRISLATRARALGVSHMIRFERGYLDSPALARLVRRADVVLLPYDSTEQVTSGVLVEAIAAGKPVIATGFPHAVELLMGGAGLLVPHQDGASIGVALHRVLTEPGLADRMVEEATRLAPALRWSTVATRYRSLANDLLRSVVAAE